MVETLPWIVEIVRKVLETPKRNRSRKKGKQDGKALYKLMDQPV